MLQRVKKLREEMKKKDIDSAIITSTANVRYFSGISDANDGAITLLFFNDSQKLIMPKQFFDKEKINKEFEIIEYNKSTKTEINNLLNDNGIKRLGFENLDISYRQYLLLSENIDIELVALDKTIDDLRMVKDDDEINNIRQACKITGNAVNYILDFIKPGVTEKEIDLELEYYMRKNGAEKLAFDTQILSGKQSAIPHAISTDKKIENGGFVLLDFGCVVNGYCSDMSRTIGVGTINEEQKKIYDTVLQSQLMALDYISAGKRIGDVDKIARDYIESNGYGSNFIHALGHGVGLSIHERPVLRKDSDIELLENMVIAVEPGIYIEDFCGVRIEDTVVVKKGGVEVLTKAPKELIIV